MIRKLAQLAGVLALAGFVVSAGLGGLSHCLTMDVGQYGPNHMFMLGSGYGKLQIQFFDGIGSSELPSWTWSTKWHEFALTRPEPFSYWWSGWHNGGFYLTHGPVLGGKVPWQYSQLSIPCWALALVNLLTAALCLRPNPPKAGETPAPR